MKTFLKHIRQFGIILILCYIIAVVFNYTFNKYYKGFSYVLTLIPVFTYTLCIYIANSMIINRYFSTKERRPTDFIKGLILTNILTVLIRVVLELLGYLIFVNISIMKAVELMWENFIGILLYPMVISSIVFTILTQRKNDKQEVLYQKKVATTATASFESLKNQLDPHFLFNSLNVLSALIEENPKKAQEFTVSLSNIYRYVLEQKNKTLVSVEEELDFAKLYVSLLQMRFENGLVVNFPEKNSVSDLQMIPLSLQLLLENAIKHNIISNRKPLIIDIFFQDNKLVVKNNYQKKETFGSKKGIGLQNIISRYALVSDQNIFIEQNENEYIVKLPLISEQIKYEYQQELLVTELFDKAYKKMEQLKEFYTTLFVTLIGIPLFVIVNLVIYPHFKWSVALGFFMLVALIINGIKTLILLKNETKTSL